MSYQQAVWAWNQHLRAGGSTPWREWLRSAPRGSGAGTAEAAGVAGTAGTAGVAGTAGTAGVAGTAGTAAVADVPSGWVAPGAAQLEFVRRAALLRAGGPRSAEPATCGRRGVLRQEPERAGFAELADLVTGRSGPGRGLAQQPLWWPTGIPGHRFGAPPVDPSQIPAEELVRIGVGALVELLLADPDPDPDPDTDPDPSPDQPGPRVHRSWRPGGWRSGYAVEGAPVTRSALQRALAEEGYVDGGRRPSVLLAVDPFDDMLAQVWSARVQHGAAVRWHGFVRRWAGRSMLPPSVDLPALARSWADRVGPDRVHVLVRADRSPASAAATTAATAAAVLRALGHRAGRPGRLPEGRQPEGRQPEGRQMATRDLSPSAVDVLRRVNAVLSVRVPPHRHASVLPGLVGSLAEAKPGPGLTVPQPFWAWARRRAERVIEDLHAGGYPVHGSLEGLLPRFEGLRTHPSRQDALAVVLDACLRRVR